MAYEIQTIEPGSYDKIAKVRHIQNINWADNLDNVFISFSFTTTEKLEVGSWIRLYDTYDDVVVFNGIITSINQTRKELYTYSGYDYGFYLEKNSATIQFKGENTTDAIKNTCKEFQLACDSLPEIPQTIKKIYKNEQVSKILKEILQTAQTKGLDKKYYYDCMNGYVNLNHYVENDNLRGVIANLHTIKSTNTISSFNISSSMENMKTRVQIFKKLDDKNVKPPRCYTTPYEENKTNIDKYGILNHIEEVEATTDEEYIKIANRKLEELNKVADTLSLSLLGDYQMHRGIIIPLKRENLGLDNKYLIKSSNHTISDSKETVNITIEKFIGTLD